MEQLLDPKTPNPLRSPPVLWKTFHWEMFHQNPTTTPHALVACKNAVSLKSSSSFLKLPPSHWQTDQDVIHRTRTNRVVESPCWRSPKLPGRHGAGSNMSALPFVVTPMIFIRPESTTNNNRTIAWSTKSHTLKITHRIGSVGRLLYPCASKACSGVSLPNVS